MNNNSKQVKVDNWGIFFLQRLQHFFDKTCYCDLTLQFENDIQLKVHRLVLNACTEYFQILEQTCNTNDDCLIMPPDLQSNVIVPIVNFMYTGILEFQESIFDQLYTTARLMNMTVLTKLLDAQKTPVRPLMKPLNKRHTVTPVTWNLQGKRIAPKTMDPDLPEQLPGRKLPIWKRKSLPQADYRSSPVSDTKYFKSTVDTTPRPTRFELPDEEDDANVFNSPSFDEISYTSKPLIGPSTREKSPKPSTSFEELKRSVVITKQAENSSKNDNNNKKENIQDFKEYLKEQKRRSDFINDDSEAIDNDLQTFNNDDYEDDDNNIFGFNADESQKSILKNDTSQTPHNKRVRFNLEEKENATSSTADAGPNQTDLSNHTKIITEVLKKYPHLVKKNKNIKLKILAKGSKPTETQVKPTSKVSYVVQSSSIQTDKKDGHWSCQNCPVPAKFSTYYAYRTHLTEVHNEKTDSQMCNLCGHVSRKQNMLLYHKYVKHNITPPSAKYNFPKCNDCPYIALSLALLTKHQNIHRHVELICSECKTLFETGQELTAHIEQTGHEMKSGKFCCKYCRLKFKSYELVFEHIKKNHREEGGRDNIISRTDDSEEPDESLTNLNESTEKGKEKIKILSNIKVNTPTPSGSIIPIRTEVQEETIVTSTPPLEPSSEAESLSNVASGIAASLGLVNTIVVLDDNQFILQNHTNSTASEFILPEMNTIENIQKPIIIDPQQQEQKDNITSTDELVMVLTDHDYNDAANNTVISSENSNIVVLYSHPVQNSENTLLINSNMDLLDMSNNFQTVNKPCEESIEMIQQEINNPTNEQPDQLNAEQMDIEETNETIEKPVEYEEPMDVEEPVEFVQKEIDNNSLETSEETVLENPNEEDQDQHQQQLTIEANENVESEKLIENETNTEDEDQEPESSIQETNQEEITQEDNSIEQTNQEEISPEDNSIEQTNQEEVIEEQANEETVQNESEIMNYEERMEVDSSKIELLTTEMNDENAIRQTEEEKCVQDEVEIGAEAEEKLTNCDEIESTNEEQESNSEIQSESVQEETNIVIETSNEIITYDMNKEQCSHETGHPEETNTKISKLLDDWDDGDTDSQQSENQIQKNVENKNSINTLINDWEDEEET